MGPGPGRRGPGVADGLCPQAAELSREEKLQLRKEKKQQKKKKRSEKGPAAEPPEPGTPSEPGQPRGEDSVPPRWNSPEPGASCGWGGCAGPRSSHLGCCGLWD